MYISRFYTGIQQNLSEVDILGLVCQSSEFQNLKVAADALYIYTLLGAR